MNNTIKGNCSGCGNCCANVLFLTEEEIQDIKQYIKDNNIQIYNHNSALNTECLDICPFLNKDKRCNIYSARPRICRNFICDGTNKEDLDYNNIKVVNMTKEFFPKAYCPPIDLSLIENRLKELQKKLQGGK